MHAVAGIAQIVTPKACGRGAGASAACGGSGKILKYYFNIEKYRYACNNISRRRNETRIIGHSPESRRIVFCSAFVHYGMHVEPGRITIGGSTQGGRAHRPALSALRAGGCSDGERHDGPLLAAKPANGLAPGGAAVPMSRMWPAAGACQLRARSCARQPDYPALCRRPEGHQSACLARCRPLWAKAAAAICKGVRPADASAYVTPRVYARAGQSWSCDGEVADQKFAGLGRLA